MYQKKEVLNCYDSSTPPPPPPPPTLQLIATYLTQFAIQIICKCALVTNMTHLTRGEAMAFPRRFSHLGWSFARIGNMFMSNVRYWQPEIVGWYTNRRTLFHQRIPITTICTVSPRTRVFVRSSIVGERLTIPQIVSWKCRFQPQIFFLTRSVK